MNRLLLYRNFEHEDLVYQMRTLAKKAQIDALTEDDLECYENCIHQMIEMAAAYGLQENLWHSVLACILANAENAFSTASIRIPLFCLSVRVRLCTSSLLPLSCGRG